jgi:hypothetical protein
MDPFGPRERARSAIVPAQCLAAERHTTALGPENLIRALVTNDVGVVPILLARLAIQPRSLTGARTCLARRLSGNEGSSGSVDYEVDRLDR